MCNISLDCLIRQLKRVRDFCCCCLKPEECDRISIVSNVPVPALNETEVGHLTQEQNQSDKVTAESDQLTQEPTVYGNGENAELLGSPPILENSPVDSPLQNEGNPNGNPAAVCSNNMQQPEPYDSGIDTELLDSEAQRSAKNGTGRAAVAGQTKAADCCEKTAPTPADCCEKTAPMPADSSERTAPMPVPTADRNRLIRLGYPCDYVPRDEPEQVREQTEEPSIGTDLLLFGEPEMDGDSEMDKGCGGNYSV